MNSDLKKFLERADMGMSGSVIYLAAPFSDPCPDVERKRVEQATKVASTLMAMGSSVYSPLTYTFELVNGCDPKQGWYEFGLVMLSRCTDLYVAQLPGWEQSVGIQLEIAFALGRCMDVSYIGGEYLQNLLDFDPETDDSV